MYIFLTHMCGQWLCTHLLYLDLYWRCIVLGFYICYVILFCDVLSFNIMLCPDRSLAICNFVISIYWICRTTWKKYIDTILSTYSVESYSLITNGRFHYTLFSALTDSITPVILFVTVGLRVGRYISFTWLSSADSNLVPDQKPSFSLHSDILW